MDYDLMFKLKKPCNNCPFRTDLEPYLSAKRIAEIIQATAFQCHKTVDYSDDIPDQGDKPQQCAGLMILLKKSNKANQIMQVGERFGEFDSNTLDLKAPVYENIHQAIEIYGENSDDYLPLYLRKAR